jgi:DNA-binding MarR family transcriptional regulator
VSAGRDRLATRFESAEASPGFVLWQVASLWQRGVREALAPLGLTHAQFVLLASAAWLATHGENGGVVTQARIAEHARVDAVMTSEVLRTLERRALVRRTAHPGDGRARRVELTPDGWALVQRAIVAVEAVDQAFFASPGPELQALARVLGARSA